VYIKLTSGVLSFFYPKSHFVNFSFCHTWSVLAKGGQGEANKAMRMHTHTHTHTHTVASFPGPTQLFVAALCMQYGKAGRAWYLFSREYDVIDKWQKK